MAVTGGEDSRAVVTPHAGRVDMWKCGREDTSNASRRRKSSGNGRRDGPDGRSDQRDEVLPTRDAQVCGDRQAERPTGRDNGPEICRECDASYSWRVSVSQNGNPGNRSAETAMGTREPTPKQFLSLDTGWPGHWNSAGAAPKANQR